MLSAKMTKMIFIGLFFVSCTLATTTSKSGIYIDNKMGQTVPVPNLTPHESKRIQTELLNLFGLKEPPTSGKPFNTKRVKRKRKEQEVPDLIRDIYRTLEAGNTHGSRGNSRLYMSSSSRLGRVELRKRYNLSHVMEKAVFNSDIIVSVKKEDKKNLVAPHLRHHRKEHAVFLLTHLPQDEILQQAELRLFRRLPRGLNESIIMKVHRVIYKDNKFSLSSEWMQQEISLFEMGWFEIELKSWVQSWLDSPHENKGIFITFTSLKGHSISPKLSGFELRARKRDAPFLVAFFKRSLSSKSSDNDISQIPKSSRVKRSAGTGGGYSWEQSQNPGYDKNYYTRQQYSNSYASNTRCQLHSFHVYFADLNWNNWIISPSNYEAYVCHGTCTYPIDHQANITNHAIVQTLMKYHDPSIPSTCCVPVVLKSINLLYTPDNFGTDKIVILRMYHNMIVASCGCR